ncbi:general transcription factor IIF subunit 1 isoform X1 [Neodiprion virginianus]|uniref:general transcription factor IIF subunit 1 isoform X1 n=2 Tax=Neodiprion fabricii TaxID=2872261 RepID=UPI001ED8DE93|nr:general transcription factor IIF subunit 1 isoform X1 [Neodiprion fabricii]XP_046605534.1 general transcription factor IIF subunit 1 isoform X1 [Neodiprion virginianus]
MSSTAVTKPGAVPSVQEYSIRVPKNSKKKHNVMRFNATLNVDFSKWSQVKMERENNMKEYKGMDEEMPKFGAGSEFGRDAREEARRKKFGITSRKYKPEDQPWILKSGGKTGKKFKGIREGGVSENAAYYVFTHAPDGAIEAFPLHEWYNFQPIQRYKALSAEEAEQEFSRRNRVINYFSLMMRKRMRNDDEGAEDDPELSEGGKGKKLGKKEKELKISEMDEWMDSDDDDSSSDEDKEKKNSEEEEDDKKKKKKAKEEAQKKKKKKKKGSDDEAFEESDDGDEEGRECDYISDSSDSESELEQQKEIKSVAEEDALRKLLASDEDSQGEENEEEKKDGEDDKDDDEDNKDKDEKEKDNKLNKESDKKKDKKKKKKQSKKKDVKKSGIGKDSSSDFSSDSGSDSDIPREKDSKKPNSAQSSRSVTPVLPGVSADCFKRKQSGSPDLSQSKKIKLDNFNSAPVTSYFPGASESGITEDAVRRYLMRKPMTTTELLQKFKSKKTGLTSEQLVNVMTQILKKINPVKQTIKNKMYLSIKAQHN